MVNRPAKRRKSRRIDTARRMSNPVTSGEFNGAIFQNCVFEQCSEAAVAGSGIKAQFNQTSFKNNRKTFELTDSAIEVNDCTIE